MTGTINEELRKTISEGLSWPDSADYDAAIDALRTVPEDKLPGLFEVLLDDPPAGLALGVAMAAGVLECGNTAGLMIALVEEPGKWFNHAERAAIRLEAIRSLGKLKDPSAVDVLVDFIRPGSDEELPMAAVQAIARIGSPACINPLLQKMNDYPPIALSAAGAIAEIGGNDALRGLIAGLRHEDELVRSASAWALGRMGDERAIEPLLKAIRESDEFLRTDIAWALGQIGGIRARLLLGALCQNDADFSVRREAARAIRAGAVLGLNSTES
jgi:HEAT repeat protein